MSRDVCKVRELKSGYDFWFPGETDHKRVLRSFPCANDDKVWIIAFISALYPEGMIIVPSPEVQVFVRKHSRLRNSIEIKKKCHPRIFGFGAYDPERLKKK